MPSIAEELQAIADEIGEWGKLDHAGKKNDAAIGLVRRIREIAERVEVVESQSIWSGRRWDEPIEEWLPRAIDARFAFYQ